MNLFMTNQGMKTTVIATLCALGLSLSAPAAIYTFNYTDAGAIPQGGATLSIEHVVSGLADTSIASVELTLMFNDSVSLLGNSSGIQGHLILGNSVDSPFASFTPVDTSGAGLHTYTLTFTGSPGSPGQGFAGLNPNDNWEMVFWDNNTSQIENGLAGYRLAVTAVPEPINVALGIFAGGALGVHGLRRWRGRSRSCVPGLPPA